jgi:hypothetical protein
MERKPDITHGAEPKRIEKRKGKPEQKCKERKEKGRVAQLVERTVDNGKAVGSKPTSPR